MTPLFAVQIIGSYLDILWNSIITIGRLNGTTELKNKGMFVNDCVYNMYIKYTNLLIKCDCNPPPL